MRRPGIRHFVLSPAVFAEVDEAGAKIQRELRADPERGLQVLGPNTSEPYVDPRALPPPFPRERFAGVGFPGIAQTGNFGTHTLKYILTASIPALPGWWVWGIRSDWMKRMRSNTWRRTGNGRDPRLHQSFKRPHRFLEVRGVTRKKPIVLLKSGATSRGGRRRSPTRPPWLRRTGS